MIDTIIYTKDNTHIENSYKVETRKRIRENCIWIVEKRKAMKYPTRSLNSYVNEWKGHNNLYKLGLFKDHTKDVDLEEPQSILWRIIWWIIGR